MNLAGEAVAHAIKETFPHEMGSPGCPITPTDGQCPPPFHISKDRLTEMSCNSVLPLLRDIRDILYAGKMDERHISSMVAGAFRNYCNELEVLGV